MSSYNEGRYESKSSRAEFLWLNVAGQQIRVTSRHLRVAKALYAACPTVTNTQLNGASVVIGLAVEWDHAPDYYKLDMLELAYIALSAAEPTQEPGSSSEEAAIRQVSR